MGSEWMVVTGRRMGGGFKFEPTLRTNIKSGTKNGGMSAPIGKRFTSALPLLLMQNVVRHI